MAKFKNISNKELVIVGVGRVKPGEVREMPEGFNNPNFEAVKAEPSKKEVDNLQTKE